MNIFRNEKINSSKIMVYFIKIAIIVFISIIISMDFPKHWINTHIKMVLNLI
ncbi:hypothetical protein DZC18_004181 [Clostridium beijerinckii]|nr:hypothetical protein [Clostridium beijerinckii]